MSPRHQQLKRLTSLTHQPTNRLTTRQSSINARFFKKHGKYFKSMTARLKRRLLLAALEAGEEPGARHSTPFAYSALRKALGRQLAGHTHGFAAPREGIQSPQAVAEPGRSLAAAADGSGLESKCTLPRSGQAGATCLPEGALLKTPNRLSRARCMTAMAQARGPALDPTD